VCGCFTVRTTSLGRAGTSGLHESQTGSFVLDADTDADGADTADGTADTHNERPR
jgi:hypothetical protein